MKVMVEADERARSEGNAAVLDWAFIREHTSGIDALIADLKAADWASLERQSGLIRSEIEEAARAYMKAGRAIVVYGMGITQHRHGAQAVQQLANLCLMRGNIGREGAGLCPVRGHSNVQGDRTVGITEIPTADFLARLGKRFGFAPPSVHGHNVVIALEAMARGEVRVFFGMGGNIVAAMPANRQVTRDAFRRLDLTVHVSTKLNRSHLVHDNEALIPALPRPHRVGRAGDRPAVDHRRGSRCPWCMRRWGLTKPASEYLKSEPAIVAGVARATLGARSVVLWGGPDADYDRIRDAIEDVFLIFEDYNKRIRH